MSLRKYALFIALSAIVLSAVNFSKRPTDFSGLSKTCIDSGLAPEKVVPACTTLIESSKISDDDLHLFLARRAWAFSRDDKYDRAVADIDQALELQPRNTATIVLRAYVHGAHGDLDAADQDFSNALELEPENVSTILNRAKFNYVRHNYEIALLDYEYALRLDPENYLATSQEIAIHIIQRDFDQAIESLNRAITIWPNNRNFLSALGRLHYGYTENYEKSLATYSRLAELKPELALNFFHLGAVHLKFGHDETGKELIEQFAAKFEERKFHEIGPVGMEAIKLKQNLKDINSIPLYRGIAYGMADRKDLAKLELEKFLDHGNAAESVLISLIISTGKFSHVESASVDATAFDDAINRYIKHIGGAMSLELLVEEMSKSSS